MPSSQNKIEAHTPEKILHDLFLRVTPSCPTRKGERRAGILVQEVLEEHMSRALLSHVVSVRHLIVNSTIIAEAVLVIG